MRNDRLKELRRSCIVCADFHAAAQQLAFDEQLELYDVAFKYCLYGVEMPVSSEMGRVVWASFRGYFDRMNRNYDSRFGIVDGCYWMTIAHNHRELARPIPPNVMEKVRYYCERHREAQADGDAQSTELPY